MTHPMPDETTSQPPKRMTTAEAAALAQKADQNASAALRVAQGADDMVAAMSEKITDLDTRLQDIGNTAITTSTDADLTAFTTRDMVDGRIHEALQPLHDEVHEIRQRTPLTSATGNLNSILARLEDAEQKVAAASPDMLTQMVAANLHPTMSNLRRRITQLEAEHEASPAADTLAEDALADQIESQVDRKLAAMFEAAGLTPARLAGLTQEFDALTRQLDDLRQYARSLDGRVPLDGQPLPDSAAGVRATLRPTVSTEEFIGGTGAQRKVLELMRLVPAIGKEKEANLGERGGRFKFRGIDDAMDAVGHGMRQVGLILSTEILDDSTTVTPVTNSGVNNKGEAYSKTLVWTTSKVTVRYTFTDPEDGSTHPMEMVGEGRDVSDKSTSKAASMALKYGLFQALMVPVTGLDDSDDAPPQVQESTTVGREATTSSRQPPGPAPYGTLPGDVTAQERTPEQRAQRAGEALKALRNVHLVQPSEREARVLQIMHRVRAEGLLAFEIEGATLDHHGKAAMATLRYDAQKSTSGTPTTDHRASAEPPDQDGSNYGETGGYGG